MTTARIAMPAVFRSSWVPAVVTSVVLLVVGGIISPGYASWQNINQILAAASILALAAAGQTLVITAGDYGIDLSVGAVMSLSAVVAYSVMGGGGAMLVVALVVVLALGAVFGLLNGGAVAFFKLPALVITLGTLVIAGGLAFALTQGGTPSGSVPHLLGALTSDNIGGIRWVTILAAVVIGALAFALRRTRYGGMLLLVGSNREAARLSGIRVRTVVIVTFVLAGMLSAFAGLILLGYAGTANLDLGGDYLLLTIAAAVIGGASLSGGDGSVARTAAGSVTLIVLSTFLLSIGVGDAVRQMITGALLLVLLTFNARAPRLRA